MHIREKEIFLEIKESLELETNKRLHVMFFYAHM